MEQDLSNVIITLMASITAGRNISSTDRQEVYLKQTLPLCSLPESGWYRTLYTDLSTPITWSSRSGNHRECLRHIH